MCKSIIIDSGNTIGNGDAGQTDISRKGFPPNKVKADGKHDLFQIFALLKSKIVNRDNAAGDFHPFQIGTQKSVFANIEETVRDRYIRHLFTADERGAGYALGSGLDRAATADGLFRLEQMRPDIQQAILPTAFIIDIGYVVKRIQTDLSRGVIDGNIGKTGAAIKSTVSDFGNTLRNMDAGQAGAIFKGIAFQADQAIG